MKNSKLNTSVRQSLFRLFCKYVRKTICGSGIYDPGAIAIAETIGRFIFFGRCGRLNLCDSYTTPSWGGLLKAIKGKARLWAEKWLGSDGLPKRSFYERGIPDLVARNITPGKEPAEFLSRPLVRVNRSQKDGEWRSNLFKFSPEFIEWLQLHKGIEPSVLADLIPYSALAQSESEYHRTMPKPKQNPCNFPDRVPMPSQPLPGQRGAGLVAAGSVVVDLLVESAQKMGGSGGLVGGLTGEDKKNLLSSTVCNNLQSTLLSEGNLKIDTDRNYLRQKGPFAVDKSKQLLGGVPLSEAMQASDRKPQRGLDQDQKVVLEQIKSQVAENKEDPLGRLERLKQEVVVSAVNKKVESSLLVILERISGSYPQPISQEEEERGSKSLLSASRVAGAAARLGDTLILPGFEFLKESKQ